MRPGVCFGHWRWSLRLAAKHRDLCGTPCRHALVDVVHDIPGLQASAVALWEMTARQRIVTMLPAKKVDLAMTMALHVTTVAASMGVAVEAAVRGDGCKRIWRCLSGPGMARCCGFIFSMLLVVFLACGRSRLTLDSTVSMAFVGVCCCGCLAEACNCTCWHDHGLNVGHEAVLARRPGPRHHARTPPSMSGRGVALCERAGRGGEKSRDVHTACNDARMEGNGLPDPKDRLVQLSHHHRSLPALEHSQSIVLRFLTAHIAVLNARGQDISDLL